MPQKRWKVTLSDGRSFAVTSDQQPTEADVMAQLGEGPADAPADPQTKDTRADGGIGVPRENVADPNRKPAKAEDYYTPNIFQQRPEASVVPGVVGMAKSLAGMGVGALQMAFSNPAELAQQDAAQRFALEQKGKTAPTAFERGAYNVASYVPMLGPAVMSAAEKLGTADPEQMGSGLTEAAAIASMAAPESTAGLADATAGRALRAVPGVVERGAKNPIVRAAAEHAASYVPGHTGRMVKALGKTMAEDKAAMPAAIADAVAKATKRKPVLPKEKQPRLTQPGLEDTLAEELAARADGLQGERPASDLPPDGLSPDAITSRVDEANTHADAVVRAQQPVAPEAVEGAQLLDPAGADAMASDLGGQLDQLQGEPASVDPNALDAEVAARLQDASESPARGTATIGPDGKPIIKSATTTYTKPSEPPVVPNAGGRLAGKSAPDVTTTEPTPTSQAVIDSLDQLRGEGPAIAPEGTVGEATNAQMGSAVNHLTEQLKVQQANKLRRAAELAKPTPPSEPPPVQPPAGLTPDARAAGEEAIAKKWGTPTPDRTTTLDEEAAARPATPDRPRPTTGSPNVDAFRQQMAQQLYDKVINGDVNALEHFDMNMLSERVKGWRKHGMTLKELKADLLNDMLRVPVEQWTPEHMKALYERGADIRQYDRAMKNKPGRYEPRSAPRK